MSFDLLFAFWFPYHTHEHFHRASHMNSIINISQSKTIGIFHIVWRVVDTYDSLELTFIMLYCEKIHQHIHIKLKPILPTTLWPIQLLDRKKFFADGHCSMFELWQCENDGKCACVFEILKARMRKKTKERERERLSKTNINRKSLYPPELRT